MDRDAWLDILEQSLGDGRDDAKRAATSHILEFRPSRVLADVEAKRRIIDEHRDDGYGECLGCGMNAYEEMCHGIEDCPTLAALAHPYADHPDYDERWRP